MGRAYDSFEATEAIIVTMIKWHFLFYKGMEKWRKFTSWFIALHSWMHVNSSIQAIENFNSACIGKYRYWMIDFDFENERQRKFRFIFMWCYFQCIFSLKRILKKWLCEIAKTISVQAKFFRMHFHSVIGQDDQLLRMNMPHTIELSLRYK